MPLRTIAADDIFISYTRRDASLYTINLARELKDKGFSCFTDRLGTVPDKDLPDTLRQKIRECKMLVIVGTQRAGTRQTIEDEIKEFLTTGRRSSIVPIDFGGAIYGARWYSLIEGVAPEPEPNPKALDEGNPSALIISRIEQQFKYARRNQRLRRATISTGALLILLILASVAAGVYANQQIRSARAARTLADQARAEAVTARDEATAAKNDATVQRNIAEAAKTAADKAKLEAEAKTRLADAATQRAADAAREAKAAKSEADHQQAIASSRADANRSQTLLRQRPDQVPRSLELAVRALKKARTVEADDSLRTGLALLPRQSRPGRTLKEDVKDTAFSPDGRHFTTLGWDDKLRIYELGLEAPPQELPCKCSLVALSNGPLSASVLTPAGLEIINLKNGERHAVRIDESGVEKQPHRIALSPGGKYIALSFDELVGPDRERVSILKVLDTSNGKLVQTLLNRINNLQINDLAFGSSGNLAVGGSQANPKGKSVGRALIFPLSYKLRETEDDLIRTTADFSTPIDFYQNEEIMSVALGRDDSFLATDRAVFKMYSLGVYEAVVRLPLPAGAGRDADNNIENVSFNFAGDQLAVVRRLAHDPADYVGSPKLLELWEAAGYKEENRAPLINVDLSADLQSIRGTDGTTIVAAIDRKLLPEKFSIEVERPPLLNIGENTAEVWNERLGKKIPLAFNSDLKNTVAQAITPDGKLLVVAGEHISLYVLDGDAYRLDKVLTKPDPATSIALTPDGQIIVADIIESNAVRVWRTRDGKEVMLKGLHDLGGSEGWQLSPAGHYLALNRYGSGIHAVYVWRLADGALVGHFEMPGIRSSPTFIFSQHERFLLAATIDTEVTEGKTRLLDLSTGRDHTMPIIEAIAAAAFSADDRYLALGIEGEVNVYLTDNPDTAIARVRQTDPIGAVAFTADADRLVVLSRGVDWVDGSEARATAKGKFPLGVWLLRPDELVKEAEKRLASLPSYAR